MPDELNPDHPFSAHNHIDLEPHMVAVLDWFILQGAEHDETRFGLESIDAVTLGEIDYYYSDPTKDYDRYIVEVTALAVQGAPFEMDTIRKMVEPVASTLDGNDYEVEVSDDVEDPEDIEDSEDIQDSDEVGTNVWVTCRLAEDELVPDRIGPRLSTLVTLANQVRALVVS